MTASLFFKQNLQVTDETFLEEPGSGVVATVNNKKVSVGTLEWITRYLSLVLLLIIVIIRTILYIYYH
jgi:cation transport ATPase